MPTRWRRSLDLGRETRVPVEAAVWNPRRIEDVPILAEH